MKLLLDMVHHNPGEPPFQTRFTDPAHLVDYGFKGQVFKHLNCVITYAATGVDVFPDGSPKREWLDVFAPGIINEIAAAKARGLKVFYHLDLFVLPKRLVELFKDEICDPGTGGILLDHLRTLELHRVPFDEIAARLPEVDGFIIRVGETYLMDTPHHTGNGPIPRIGESWTPTYLYEETLGIKPADENRWTHAQVDAYVKLIGFLRDEICEKHGRTLLFRTWDIFPDRFHARLDHYLEVTDRIEPHPRLAFSIKHTALDFWRRVKVNECLLQGRHPQIIEAQCQREYEGKGEYPNYAMEGVINGFEENTVKTGLKALVDNPRIIGIYSWSRGGGWYGPYISNELGPDLNAFVLARFIGNPQCTEEEIFKQYAAEKLDLSGADIDRFRELCLLSARAILKGRYCEAFDRLLGEAVLPCANWMRDDRLGGSEQLETVLETLEVNGQLDEALAEKTEAVELWANICTLAGQIAWPAGGAGDFIKLSAEYGRLLFSIVNEGWRVLIEGRRSNIDALALAVARYDELWAEYRRLGERPGCPSLYLGRYFGMPGAPDVPGMDESVGHYRHVAGDSTAAPTMMREVCASQPSRVPIDAKAPLRRNNAPPRGRNSISLLRTILSKRSMPHEIRIGIRTHDLGCFPAGELAGRVAAAGFDCVQLALAKAIKGVDLSSGVLESSWVEEVASAFRSQGVGIEVLGCYINPIHPNDSMRRVLLDFFQGAPASCPGLRMQHRRLGKRITECGLLAPPGQCR